MFPIYFQKKASEAKMIRSESPLVSIIIVNYNGKKYLLNCLRGVFASAYPNYEVIVADNGSTDGSIEMVKEEFGGKVKILGLGKNFGPAYARNRGVEKAKGKYLAFLDNDTIPKPSWLNPLVSEMEKDKTIGACQCKLLLASDRKRFDYAGDYLSKYGFLVQRVKANTIDKGQFDQKEEILSAKSAGMMIRKEVFKKVGEFDEDYFIYLEETDLGWRVWLAGLRIIFVPESVVYHEFGTVSFFDPQLGSFNAKFHGTKNYIITLFKNLGILNLIKIVPRHVFLWVGLGSFLIFKGQFREGFYVWRGIFWVFLHFPSILKKRFAIQRKRVVSDKDLTPKLMRKVPFSYFFKKATTVEKVGYAEGFYRPKA